MRRGDRQAAFTHLGMALFLKRAGREQNVQLPGGIMPRWNESSQGICRRCFQHLRCGSARRVGMRSDACGCLRIPRAPQPRMSQRCGNRLPGFKRDYLEWAHGGHPHATRHRGRIATANPQAQATPFRAAGLPVRSTRSQHTEEFQTRLAATPK